MNVGQFAFTINNTMNKYLARHRPTTKQQQTQFLEFYLKNEGEEH